MDFPFHGGSFCDGAGAPVCGEELAPPPILGALIAGILATMATDNIGLEQSLSFSVVRPHRYLPTLSIKAMLELVIPLAITVVVIQNAQGLAILKEAGDAPPVNTLTVASDVGSAFWGLVFGFLTSWVMERDDLRHLWKSRFSTYLLGQEACLNQRLADLFPLVLCNRLQGWANNRILYAAQNGQGLLHSVVHVYKRLRIKNTNERIEAIIYLAGPFQVTFLNPFEQLDLDVCSHAAHSGYGTVGTENKAGEKGH